MATAIVCDYCRSIIDTGTPRYVATIALYEQVAIDPTAPVDTPPVNALPSHGDDTGGLTPTDAKRVAYHPQCWALIEPYLTEGDG